MELKNIAWVEKYRPQKLEDVVGIDREKIRRYLKDASEIPHFLFHSQKAGSGKTSLAKVIRNELDCDMLMINASDERGIDTVRTKVKEFARSRSTNGVRKMVFMDEFDGNLKGTQEALRNAMEEYASNVFFVLTANSIERIIEPIRSRCTYIDFSRPDKNEILVFLKKICENEELGYTDTALQKLIDTHYPSIRNCVRDLQDIYVSGGKADEEFFNKNESIYDKIWKMIAKADVEALKESRRIIIQDNVDVMEMNKYLFYQILPSLPPKQQIALLPIINQNNVEFTRNPDPMIVFVSRIPNIIKAMQTK